MKSNNKNMKNSRSDFYKREIEGFQEDLNLDPKNNSALIGLVKVYYSVGDFEKAKQFANKVLENDIHSAEAYIYLAYIYIKNEMRLDLAQGFITRALIEDPKSSEARFCQGVIFLMNKDYQDAIDNFNSVLTIFSDEYLVRLNLAAGYVMLRQFNKASQQYWKMFHLRPSFESLYLFFANVFSNPKLLPITIALIITSLVLGFTFRSAYGFIYPLFFSLLSLLFTLYGLRFSHNRSIIYYLLLEAIAVFICGFFLLILKF